MKRVALVIGVLLLPFFAAAQKKYTISGYVVEKSSKESLIGVTIYLDDYQTGTSSNSYGFYSLTIPEADSVTLFCSYVGYRTETIKVALHADITFNIQMEKGVTLEAVSVSGERKKSEEVQMSSITITPAEIKSMPMLLGEKDVFKTLQLLPGVSSGTEGTSGLYVRGGGPDQNLIIMDEAVIYNASHLMGFFSTFNGNAIKSVELLKGGFPARYGGRLSSIIDINMKEGSKQKYHGEGGIGLISAHAMVEGPIVKDKSSFMVSARRTYMDLFMKLFTLGQDYSVGYHFYDLNAKFNYDFGDKNKLYISGFFGRDKFGMTEKSGSDKYAMGLYWQNGSATVRWNHLFSNKLFSNLSFVFSDYKMDVYQDAKAEDELYNMEYFSGIRDYSLKFDMSYVPNPNHTIKMGAIVTFHEFSPSAFVLKETSSNTNIKRGVKQYALESALYAEDEMKIGKKIRINPGVRLVLFSTQQKSYFSPEPRLNMSYMPFKDFAIKASYALMSQPLHLLSNSSIGLPTDLWVPATANIKPQQSQQVALGVVYDWDKPKLSFSLEGYYKKMDRIIAYKESSSFIVFDGVSEENENTNGTLNWEKNITTGHGWASGLEFLVRRTSGKVSGWVGYTLSWVQHRFSELNFGEKFYPRYDRRHDVSIVLMYSPTKKINITATWVYATGNAITLPQSVYGIQSLSTEMNQFIANNTPLPVQAYIPYETVDSYGARNNVRMKAFHHLDIGVQFIKKHKKWEGVWEISIYNVYNNKNAFFYYIDSVIRPDGTYETVLKQVTVFPIIPSVSYTFRF